MTDPAQEKREMTVDGDDHDCANCGGLALGRCF